MSRRDELIELCQREPEKVVDLLLALEAKVNNLEKRLNMKIAVASDERTHLTDFVVGLWRIFGKLTPANHAIGKDSDSTL